MVALRTLHSIIFANMVNPNVKEEYIQFSKKTTKVAHFGLNTYFMSTLIKTETSRFRSNKFYSVMCFSKRSHQVISF